VAFRESIEAILKVKDAARFKASMEGAAKAVRKFGRDEEYAAASAELLDRIEKELKHQTEELSVTMEVLAHSVDNLGDQMLQTAAKAEVMNTVTKKSGSNAFFLGKSFAFWKDRLSLTRSEILSTTYTVGAYFIPAIIALGNSFVNAMFGGGAVAGAGLSSLLFGFGTFIAIAKPVTDNIKKIWAAQNQYNQAVAEFGAASSQASRASAHLYGVIQTHGGKAVYVVEQQLRGLRKEWMKSTGPARGSVLGMISDALGTGKQLMPQVAGEANQMMASLRKAFGKGLSTLVSGPSGGEFRNTLRVLGDTFSKSIGPGIHGVSNMILVLGRVVRAAAPWVVKLSKAWDAWTESLVARTSDQGAVEKFINNAVKSFKLWWGLLKAIGRTFKILFGASKNEGDKVVTVLTNGVNALNDWLQNLKDTGTIKKFWDTWNNSVTGAWNALKNALLHPETILPNILRAIDTIAPIIMNHLATAIVVTAPVAADHFARAFLNAGAWAKFFVVAYFLRKFGFFRLLGSLVADKFVGPFVKKFIESFTAALGFEVAEGQLATKFGAAGTAMGGRFGLAFKIAAVPLLIAAGIEFNKWLQNQQWFKDFINMVNKHTAGHQGGSSLKTLLTGHIWNYPKGFWEALKGFANALGQAGSALAPRTHAIGGTIPPGGMGIVGEAGPELAFAHNGATQITPLRGMNPITSMPHIAGDFSVTVNSQIMVDRREIARAVATERAYVRARRT
jgi:hypothetical protein